MRLIGAGTRDDIDYVITDRVWTVPNVITILRFCLVPVFVWLVVSERYLGAFLVLAVLSSTDWVDGYVARRFNQVSTVGQWLDPVADRLSLVVVAVTLVATGIAPWWLVAALVVPDLVLGLTALVLFGGSPGLEVTVLGKVRTALLLLGTPVLLLARVPGPAAGPLGVVAYVLLAAGCIGHVLAAADYLVGCIRKHRGLRAAGLDPRDRTGRSRA
ncbi:CDP-alcohol phosphatidyltransferase family protein [Citricoccus sp. SGAir0253]|uniref:CDP-alcohol phosphatidyltransferase family protein n=1 Tax=Citricoccus sp. SGAir0253 TaxID=2567881 RepID=UPI0010CD39EE|nr:CDP-alcohol phosphatidyltransferase family protein [Citricoccus sp. SGAir0253]QCU78551.1 CDP-alcohol phosphatidyltransferase family protein [Citricoccus sp. SGAir0253]